MADLAYDDEHLKRLVVLWAENTLVHQLAARLLAVREALPVKFALSTLDGHIQTNKESVFNSQQEAERVLAALSKALSTKINLKIVPLYTSPLAPAVPGYKFDGLNIRAVAALREAIRDQWLKSEEFADKVHWQNMHSIANEIMEAMAAAPTK